MASAALAISTTEASRATTEKTISATVSGVPVSRENALMAERSMVPEPSTRSWKVEM